VRDLEPLVDVPTLQALSCNNLKIREFPHKLLFSESLQKLQLLDATIPGIPDEILSSDSSSRPSFAYNCLPPPASARPRSRSRSDPD
jgi:hypothetical protein